MLLRIGVLPKQLDNSSSRFIIVIIWAISLCLFTISLLFTSKVASAQISSTNSFTWDIQRVDAPKLFADMTDRSLRLDANGHPHIAYGGDYLYYAWHDGTVWRIETVDTSEGVGSYASLALDVNSNPHISYYDERNRNLKYAHKTEAGWEIETVDSNGDVGSYTSIALDVNGNSYIAYCDWGNFVLKCAHWTGSTWDIQTVDSSGRVGDYASLALDRNGNPHISYIEFNSGKLKYARWTGISWDIKYVGPEGIWRHTSLALDSNDSPHISYAGSYTRLTESGWETQVVDGAANGFNSLALDSNDNPHISYYDQTHQALKYARLTENSWILQLIEIRPDINNLSGSTFIFTSLALDELDNPHISYFGFHDGIVRHAYCSQNIWNIEIIDKAGKAGLYPSLALHGNGDPHISYLDTSYGELKYTHWTGSAWDMQVVDNSSFTGYFTSLSLDSHGYPHISYYNLIYGDLRYARWTGSGWEIQTVDSPPEGSLYTVGWYSSLAIDKNDNPHISYFDENGTSVKYAHWTGTSWDIQIVDQNNAQYAKMTSIAIDNKNFPHIIYEGDPMSPKYARWTGSNWDIQSVDNFGEIWTSSLALDTYGNAHISYCKAYYNDAIGLTYAHWTGSDWIIQVLDLGQEWSDGLGYHSSLSLDSRGDPHISYYDRANKKLKYARYTGLAWDIQTVDHGTDVGMYTSLFLDGNDNPHIAYYDNYLGDLKYAKGTLVGPDISVSSSAIDFNSVYVGNVHNETITIRNDGAANLIVGTIESPSFPFSITGGTCTDGMTLGPSMNCSLVVRFAPYTPGSFNSTFRVFSNDADENPVNINLNGTGVAILPYTITSIPEGLQLKVDGSIFTSPVVVNWSTGSTHTIEAISPQAEFGGSRLTFSSWSDGEVQSHSITTHDSSSTYTANFILQYALTTSINPPGVGTVYPPGTTWHDKNEYIYMSSSDNNIYYTFNHWSGDLSGTANPLYFNIDRPMSVTANYMGKPPETISVPSAPSGDPVGYTIIPYEYSTVGAYSNLLHPVEYQFDWKGDGTDLSSWGSAIQAKAWTKPGTYNVRARARCIDHISVVSPWSGTLSVNISDRVSLQSPPHGAIFDSCSLIAGHQPSFTWTANGAFSKFNIFFSTFPIDFATPGILIAKANILYSRNSWQPSIHSWRNFTKLSYSDGNIRDIYWKVVGTGPDQTTTESEVRGFRIGIEQPVTTNFPQEGTAFSSDIPPNFEFNSNCNAKLRLEFSPSSDFENVPKIKGYGIVAKYPNVEKAVDKILTKGQWNSVKKLIGTGMGYFRIRAWDKIKRETVSEVRSFTIH